MELKTKSNVNNYGDYSAVVMLAQHSVLLGEYHNAINKGLALQTDAIRCATEHSPPTERKTFTKGVRGAAKRREGPQVLRNKAAPW